MAVTKTQLGPGTLEIGDPLAAPPNAGIGIECQTRKVILTPDVDEGDSDRTLCGDDVSGADTLNWQLEGEVYQDWNSSVIGVSRWSIEHALEEVPFKFVPLTASAGLTEVSGTLKMIPLQVGGETKENLTAEFEWKLIGQPVWVWAV